MTKQELRKHYLAQRKALTDDEYTWRNQRLLAQLREAPGLIGKGPAHIFLPIEKFREVDTWPIIHWLWGNQVATMTSVTNTAQGTLDHVWFDRTTRFETNAWGIPEPVQAPVADPAACSVVFVPLIVADKRGHRIGYGKGFYDIFLAELPQSVSKIGLSLLPLVDDLAAPEPHDIPVDRVFTP